MTPPTRPDLAALVARLREWARPGRTVYAGVPKEIPEAILALCDALDARPAPVQIAYTTTDGNVLLTDTKVGTLKIQTAPPSEFFTPCADCDPAEVRNRAGEIVPQVLTWHDAKDCPKKRSPRPGHAPGHPAVVEITWRDDETGLWWCRAHPKCRPPVGFESSDAERDACYDGNFPHTEACPARRALEAARAAAGGEARP